MFNGSLQNSKDYSVDLGINNEIQAVMASSDSLIGIEEVQKSLNRSRASVYRYTNTDTRNINPAFNPRKLNPEYRTDQKDPLLFHPNEVARFAKDILRIKEVNVEVLNSPSTVTQNVLNSILEELRAIRLHLESNSDGSKPISSTQDIKDRSVA
ncbi:resolvase [Prochlorococcus sp. MIT 1223]|uniref:resolvase n=1 Tax=Prochlorococcus sp. MIT 1223 TaxID=3096217 RepID=UPI002A74D6DE|nr:resolvase [Prochlorococcus sp. MIT 1223]